MAVADALVQRYFDLIYNPSYDWTVGRFSAYRRLQERCVGRCSFRDGDRVLCVGVGTGNELGHILELGRSLELVGIDTSGKALRRAREKAARAGHDLQVFRMDARRLGFPDECFDIVVCIHVMDFVGDVEQATAEILRVLRPGGEFVVTFPWEMEGATLGANIVREGLYQDLRYRRFRAALAQVAALVGVSLVYAPILLRPRRRVFEPAELAEMFRRRGAGAMQVESDDVYLDLIASGEKEGFQSHGAEADASGGRVLLHAQR